MHIKNNSYGKSHKSDSKAWVDSVKPKNTPSGGSPKGIINNPKGNNQYKQSDDCDNISVIQNRQSESLSLQKKVHGSTGKEYRMAVLKRDRPDIVEAYKRGEYKSVNEAWKAAGKTTPKCLPLDPVKAATKIMKDFDEVYLKRLVQELKKKI